MKPPLDVYCGCVLRGCTPIAVLRVWEIRKRPPTLRRNNVPALQDVYGRCGGDALVTVPRHDPEPYEIVLWPPHGSPICWVGLGYLDGSIRQSQRFLASFVAAAPWRLVRVP